MSDICGVLTGCQALFQVLYMYELTYTLQQPYEVRTVTLFHSTQKETELGEII